MASTKQQIERLFKYLHPDTIKDIDDAVTAALETGSEQTEFLESIQLLCSRGQLNSCYCPHGIIRPSL